MPCPYFEPTRIATDPQAAHARLPLLSEHDGLCHACGTPQPSPREWRFAGCNHGRDQACCPRLPAAGLLAIRRFTVKAQTETTLSVLVSEEVAHVPVRWRQVVYSTAQRAVLDGSTDVCELAQIRAFCSTYLQRFAQPLNT